MTRRGFLALLSLAPRGRIGRADALAICGHRHSTSLGARLCAEHEAVRRNAWRAA